MLRINNQEIDHSQGHAFLYNGVGIIPGTLDSARTFHTDLVMYISHIFRI
jgi:hypothetical protein